MRVTDSNVTGFSLVPAESYTLEGIIGPSKGTRVAIGMAVSMKGSKSKS